MNARLNFRRKAEELAPSMFRLTEQRPRGVDAMFGSSNPQSVKARGDRLILRQKGRASRAQSFSHK